MAAHTASHPWSNNTQSQTFLGTIKKWGDSFWLANTSEKVAVRLDDPSTANHFVNQRVKVSHRLTYCGPAKSLDRGAAFRFLPD